MSERGVILFHTTSSAFAAERALKKASLECTLVPTPREFSSDCGVALRFDWSRHDAVIATLDASDVEYAEVHKLG